MNFYSKAEIKSNTLKNLNLKLRFARLKLHRANARYLRMIFTNIPLFLGH